MLPHPYVNRHAARGRYCHAAGFYSSDEEFRRLIVPFAQDSVAAGDPVIVAFDERKSGLLRGWLAEPAGVTFIADPLLYATPARAIESWRRLFERLIGEGAREVRLSGDVPHAGNGGRFDGWDRYESALNALWASYPVRSLCLYDAATISPTVRDVVERTHPRLMTPAGERVPSDRYEDPSAFVGLAPATDPLEAAAPLVELDAPTAAQARAALCRVAGGRVSETTVRNLELGISEAVANAHVHGRVPAGVRIWAAGDRVVVHVRDGGPGPTDRLAGLTRAQNTATGGGVGLWLVHQLEIDVALMPEPDGFTVRLRGGALPAPVA